MGIETEYGISVPGHPNMNPMVSSSQIVNAYGQYALRGARPQGALGLRGREPRCATPAASTCPAPRPTRRQLTDDDLGMANVILTNGSRLYVDHAHPELSTPEVTNPRDAVLWDRAGVEIMRAAMRLAAAVPQAQPIVLYKNNTDNKGASYGCHENYLMRRTTPFADIVRHLTPFFITRQVFTRRGPARDRAGRPRSVAFQISQRADFFEVEVGLETTLKRPIINTRDEPHADPERFRRLHVIVGDANLSDTATYLKIGTTARRPGDDRGGLPARPRLDAGPAGQRDARGLARRRPRLTDRDADGRRMTALQVQWELYELRRRVLPTGRPRGRSTPRPRTCSTSGDASSSALETRPGRRSPTESTGSPSGRSWRASCDRDGLAWDSPRLQLIDLQYSDIRPDKGLAARLEERGRLRRMFTDDEVARAVDAPPEDTRAYFRGECIRRYPDAIAAASWDSVVFDVPGTGVAPARADPRAAPRHARPRRGPARRVPRRRHPDRPAHRRDGSR